MIITKNSGIMKAGIVHFLSIIIVFILSACSEDSSSGSAVSETEEDNRSMLFMSASYAEFDDKIRVSWCGYQNAEYYRIYLSDAADGSFREIQTDEPLTENSYDSLDVMHYKSYFYRIRACNGRFCTGLSRIMEGLLLEDKGEDYEYCVFDENNILVGGLWKNPEYNPDGGTEEGEFRNPSDIAVADDGSFYVANTGNSRIGCFSPNGIFTESWGRGTEGDHYLDFSSPQGIAVNKDTVVVADTGNNRIKIYKGNVYDKMFGSSGTLDGEFNSPGGVAVNSCGTIFVADTLNHRVQVFDSEGEFLGWWGIGDTDPSTGQNCAWHGPTSHLDSGEQLYGGIQGNSSTGLNSPSDIEVSSDGSVYVLNSRNYNVRKFSWNETSESLVYLHSFGQRSFNNVDFRNPRGISVDRNGYVYVSDPGEDNLTFERIQKFDHNGNFIKKWGRQGTGAGRFDKCAGMDLDQNNDLFVVDSDNHRIQKFVRVFEEE